MLVSTKGRYALRIMIDLAEHQRDGYIPLKETAGRQGISEKYLEGIIKILVKDKMLTGVRGKGGGYKLTKTPDQYTVGSILYPVWNPRTHFPASAWTAAVHSLCGEAWIT